MYTKFTQYFHAPLSVTSSVFSAWLSLLTPQGIPQQKNDSDCGVFVLEVRLWFFFSTSQIIFHSHFPSSLFSISQQPSFITVEEINHIFYHRLHCRLRSTVGRFARSPGEGVKTLMRSFCQHPRCIRESLGYYVSLSLCLSVCLSVCQYCRRLSVKQPLLFSQEDMPRIRKRIYKELCDCRFDAWTTNWHLSSTAAYGFFLVSSTPGQTHTGTDAHSLLHKQTQFDFLVFPECRSHSHSELLTQSHETLSPGYVDTLQLVSRSVSFFFFFFLMQTWKELLTWPPTDLPPRMLDQNTSVLILNSVIKHPENFNPSSSSLTEDADDGAVWTNRQRLCLPGGVAFSHRVDFLSWKILRTVLCWIHSSNMPINIHINEVELCDPVDQLFTLYLNTWVGYI